jgi:hypothetical protein
MKWVNWKTGICGVLIAISQVGGLFGLPPKIIQATTAVCAATGLIASKDHDVTGGTRPQ